MRVPSAPALCWYPHLSQCSGNFSQAQPAGSEVLNHGNDFLLDFESCGPAFDDPLPISGLR